jgi:TRAP-type mannitol/chloroaromatic compound transport system permease small subunit
MSGKLRAIRAIERVNEAVGSWISFGIPVMAFLLLYEVVMRYGFNRPTIWVHDISQFVFGACYMLGAGFTLLRRGHVNMDMLYTRFSKRGKALADIISGLLLLLFLIIMVYQSGIMAYESVLFNEHLIQSVFEPPLYPIKIIFFVGFILFLLQGLGDLVQNLIILFTGNEPAEESEAEGR